MTEQRLVGPGAGLVVGKRLVRSDARLRVTGDLVYGMDFSLPGMLHGHVFRSSEPHAEIVRLDTSQAAALPGVRAVLTADDLARPRAAMRLPGTISDTPVLAVGKVRYVGEPVALIAATTPEVAQQAAGLIEVEYRRLPVVDDPERAIGPDSPLVHEDWQSYAAAEGTPRYGNVACHATLVKGDADAAFAAADHVFEERYTTHSVHQTHIEPSAAVVDIDANGKVTVHSNTQLPYAIRSVVAAVLQVPVSQVRVIVEAIGGGFGAKLLVSVEHFCALLARATGRPVRMASSVEEQLSASYPRHPFTIDLKTGVSADGTIVAQRARAIMDTGAYAGSGPKLAAVVTLALSGVYKTPNLDVHAYAVYTNKMNFGPYRAPGGPQANFALESHVDTIAEKLGMDPLAFRLKNIVSEGDEGPNGQPLEGVGLRECLERAAAAIEWDKPRPSPRPGRHRGKGLACGWWTTTGGPSACYAKLQPDGKFTVYVGAAEIGTGAVMHGTAQVWAEALGVDLDDVEIVSADTDVTPYDFGSQGSRTLFNVANAALDTAADMTQQLKALAAELLEVAPVDLEVADRAIRVKGSPEHKVTFVELAQRALAEQGDVIARGSYNRPPVPYDESSVNTDFYPTFNSPSFHCHATEVEVDPVTGDVQILKYVAAHDVGFAVDPPGIEGQIYGGVVQGIGMALMEEIIYADGRVTNPNLTDYKVPTIADVPDIEAIIVEHPNSDGPFGANGVGEPPVISPPAAIANAIKAATGKRIRDLPITPEKVLRALLDSGV